MTVKDYFPDIDDFEELLELAESGAETDWEFEFTEDIREKFDKYRENMYLSDAQKESLERIADK